MSCSLPRGRVSVTVWDFLCRLLWMALLGGLITWLALDTSRNPEQLISLAGFCFLVLFLFACSKHHGAVCVSGVAWPSVPSQDEATQHWGTSASFPLASPDGPVLELPGGSRSPAGLLGRAGHSLGNQAGCVDGAPKPPHCSPSHCSPSHRSPSHCSTQGSPMVPPSCFPPCPS